MSILLAHRVAALVRLALTWMVPLTMMSCAAIQQYPADPEDTQATLASYADYFGASWIERYSHSSGDNRTAVRDDIVLNRMLAYEVTYSDFKRRLVSDGSAISTGGDLLGLILTGLTATTGNAATKAALGAAAAGVIGARGAINSDLFYQRTLPALIAQMDANRAQVQLAILTGLARPDSEYPLGRALVDLAQLRDAGGVTQAIQEITSSAVTARATSEREINLVHGRAFRDSFTARQSIVDAIGKLSPSQVLALAKAMDARLAERPPATRALVQAADPSGARETQPQTASDVLRLWAATEDAGDASTTDRFAAEWQSAIADAKNK